MKKNKAIKVWYFPRKKFSKTTVTKADDKVRPESTRGHVDPPNKLHVSHRKWIFFFFLRLFRVQIIALVTFFPQKRLHRWPFVIINEFNFGINQARVQARVENSIIFNLMIPPPRTNRLLRPDRPTDQKKKLKTSKSEFSFHNFKTWNTWPSS